MKNILKKLLILASVAGFALPAMAGLGPVNLFLVQSGSTVNTVSFDLDISGLQSSLEVAGYPSLGAFDVTLNFNSAVVAVQSPGSNYGVAFGTNLGLNGNPDSQFVLPDTAKIELFDISNNSAAELEASQPSAFTLATVTFDVLGAGAPAVTIDPASSLSDENGQTLAAVPEPSASMLGLVGAGLFSLVYLRRRYARLAC